MARSQTKVPVNDTEANTQPIKTYSFNYKGYGMLDPCPDRPVPQIIRARMASGTAIGGKLTLLLSQDQVYRKKLDLTDEEKTFVDSGKTDGTEMYLIIGYTTVAIIKECATGGKSYGKRPSGKVNQAPFGAFKPLEEDTAQCDTNPGQNQPLYVVVRLKDPGQHKLGRKSGVVPYVLTTTTTGFCQPWTLSKEATFWRSEYRDTSTDEGKRTSNWGEITNGVIRKALEIDTGESQAFRKVVDLGLIPGEAGDTLVSDIVMELTAAEMDPSYRVTAAENIKQFLGRVNQAALDVPDTDSLEEFCVAGSTKWNAKHAEELVADAQIRWDGMEDLNKTRVMILKDLVDCYCSKFDHPMLLYCYLAGVLRYGTYYIKTALKDDGASFVNEDPKLKAASHIIDTVLRVVGQPPKSPQAIPQEQELTLLSSIHTKLRQILDNAEGHIDKLKDNYGDTHLQMRPMDGWYKYSNMADTESARLAFLHNCRYSVGYITHILDSVVQSQLRKVVGILDKLNLDRASAGDDA